MRRGVSRFLVCKVLLGLSPVSDLTISGQEQAGRSSQHLRELQKPKDYKLSGWQPVQTKPRKQELWQAILERDPSQRPKNWKIEEMVKYLIKHPKHDQTKKRAPPVVFHQTHPFPLSHQRGGYCWGVIIWMVGWGFFQDNGIVPLAFLNWDRPCSRVSGGHFRRTAEAFLYFHFLSVT